MPDSTPSTPNPTEIDTISENNKKANENKNLPNMSDNMAPKPELDADKPKPPTKPKSNEVSDEDVKKSLSYQEIDSNDEEMVKIAKMWMEFILKHGAEAREALGNIGEAVKGLVSKIGELASQNAQQDQQAAAEQKNPQEPESTFPAHMSPMNSSATLKEPQLETTLSSSSADSNASAAETNAEQSSNPNLGKV